MRQWVLSLPKRLRPALRNHAALATRVLRIFIGSNERELRRGATAPAHARPSTLSFLQRFGSALNENWHYHCYVGDGGIVGQPAKCTRTQQSADPSGQPVLTREPVASQSSLGVCSSESAQHSLYLAAKAHIPAGRNCAPVRVIDLYSDISQDANHARHPITR